LGAGGGGADDRGVGVSRRAKKKRTVARGEGDVPAEAERRVRRGGGPRVRRRILAVCKYIGR